MDDMVVRGEENQGFINRLPDDILSFILSKLRIDEAVRCNILSKRWVGLWKKTSHVEFNAKYMIRPITQLQYSRESHIINSPDFILNPLFMQKGVYRYGILVFLLMHRHSGDISSCRFLHFRKSLAFGEVNSWVGFLAKKKKGLTDLSLECVPDYRESEDEFSKPCFSRGIFCCLGSLELINYTIDCWYAFENCLKLTNLKLKRIQLDEVTLSGILENCVVLENFSLLESYGFTRLVIIMKSKLRVLKLQALCVDLLEIFAENLEVMFLDSIICPAKNLSIYAPSLHNLCSDYNSIFSIMPFVEERESIVKTHEILACYSDLSERPSCNVFKNLSTLSMDLDLDHIEEVVDLYFVLKLCTSLQVLEITMPVFKHENFGGSTSNDYASPYPISNFWERQDLCNCISQKLKFVTIRGFSGKEQEVQFAMHLIKRAPMMKRITIICNDQYSIDEAAKKLLSLPRASAELSINLKFNANNPTCEFIEHQN